MPGTSPATMSRPLPAVARLVDTGDTVPLFLGRVSAGPPLPVEADLYDAVALADLLGMEGTSYLVRAEGSSMVGAGIHPGDALVVNTDTLARDGDIVVAAVGGHLTVKRARRSAGDVWLEPAEGGFDPIPVPPDADDVAIWGVVATVVRSLR